MLTRRTVGRLALAATLFASATGYAYAAEDRVLRVSLNTELQILDPIVTTIEDMTEWYPAEDYHQQYWEGEGQRNPYCMAVIPPKLQKLRKSFAARVKV